MKKFRNLLLALVVLFMSINVNAMTENELVAKIKKAYVIDCVEVKITASQVTELERYLNKY